VGEGSLSRHPPATLERSDGGQVAFSDGGRLPPNMGSFVARGLCLW